MYNDIEAKRRNGRKWMNKWRKAHPEEAREKGRNFRLRELEKAKVDRLFPKYAWHSMKNGAKSRGLSFDLEREDFPIPGKCPVLGLSLDWSSYANTPSLDRIHNDQGYISGNVVVVSRRVNNIKGAATVQELKAMGDFYARFTS